ncbi:hypothetical protein ABZY45_24330 [Streptomyces sp. NPDC006516]|uniref:hypothetical protein n=1 Tax=Streptomyces sp. NPDC006516 TaxID=3154309 RepID=UPI0033B78618
MNLTRGALAVAATALVLAALPVMTRTGDTGASYGPTALATGSGLGIGAALTR